MPERFRGDKELLSAFGTFQGACVAAMHAAHRRRAELAQQGAEAGAGGEGEAEAGGKQPA